MDDEPVILKLMNSEHPSTAELTRYRHEYELTRALSHLDSIVDVLALEPLEPEDVNQLTADSLFADSKRARTLTESGA